VQLICITRCPVFPKVNWSWMDIRSSKGVQITGPNIKFSGHSYTPQRRCSDSYWSFCFTGHCHISDRPWEWLDVKVYREL